tara:strand:+ start:442 stop:876 length:435 start_codon:yes stop_codon:yes gene_type:complete
MATTTASLAISSSDLQPGNQLSINASSTLMKSGLTTGLTQVRSGYESIAIGTEFRLGPLATEMVDDKHDIVSWVYLANLATDDTHYIDWGLDNLMMGRLYAGDWMFIPWNAAVDAAEIEIEAQVASQTIEYTFFASDFILTTAA